MVYSLAAAPGPGGRAPKGLVKQKPKTKMTNIVLDKITRTDFIKAFLATHNLSDKYSPGVHSGPDFKLWWSGSPYVLFLILKSSPHLFAVVANPGQQLSRQTTTSMLHSNISSPNLRADVRFQLSLTLIT